MALQLATIAEWPVTDLCSDGGVNTPAVLQKTVEKHSTCNHEQGTLPDGGNDLLWNTGLCFFAVLLALF